MRFLNSFAAALGFMSLLASPLTAHADLSLRLSDGITTVTIADGGAGDVNSAVGAITFVGALGTWSLNVSTALGTAQFPGRYGLDLNSLNTTSAAGTLRIEMSESNLSVAGPSAVGGSIGGNVWGGVASVEYGLFVDSDNVLFDRSTTVAYGTLTPGAGGLIGASYGGAIAADDSFSMTLATLITARQAGGTSFDFKAEIPEPSSAALMGLALLGLGAVSRRRRR